MSDNCSTEAVDNVSKHFDMVIYVPVLVFGLPLNIAALVVFCVLLRKWTESSIYMTNLALMDLLLLLQLPFKMHAAQHKWTGDKKLFCSFLETLYFVGMYGSIYTIACIAIDRYIAIKHPFRAKQLRSKKIALLVCVFIWVFVMTATSPIYTFREEVKGQFHCFHGFSQKGWSTALIICLEVLGFLLPATVLVVCSTQSVLTLKASESSDSVVLLLGLPLNFVSLWILVCRNGLRKSVPVIYMANLALSDLLFILSLPFRIIYFATGRWTLGNTLCMIPGTLFAVNLYSSSLFITLISVDRMLAVVYPLRSRSLRTAPVAWALCATVWLLIGGLSVPTALNHCQSKDEQCNVTRCFEKYTDDAWERGFRILCCVTVFGILVPFGIILACTVAVVRQLKGCSIPASSSNTEMSKNKIVKLFLSNLLIYAVCFIPFHIAFILYGLNRNRIHGYIYFNLQTVTMCMASTNSCLDPLIYYFSLRKLQGRPRCDSSTRNVALGLIQSTSWTAQ